MWSSSILNFGTFIIPNFLYLISGYKFPHLLEVTKHLDAIMFASDTDLYQSQKKIRIHFSKSLTMN